jgi:hypothetical protein
MISNHFSSKKYSPARHLRMKCTTHFEIIAGGRPLSGAIILISYMTRGINIKKLIAHTMCCKATDKMICKLCYVTFSSSIRETLNSSQSRRERVSSVWIIMSLLLQFVFYIMTLYPSSSSQTLMFYSVSCSVLLMYEITC